MDNNKLSNMLQHITSIRKSRATGVIVVSSDNINHAKSNRSKKRGHRPKSWPKTPEDINRMYRTAKDCLANNFYQDNLINTWYCVYTIADSHIKNVNIARKWIHQLEKSLSNDVIVVAFIELNGKHHPHVHALITTKTRSNKALLIKEELISSWHHGECSLVIHPSNLDKLLNYSIKTYNLTNPDSYTKFDSDKVLREQGVIRKYKHYITFLKKKRTLSLTNSQKLQLRNKLSIANHRLRVVKAKMKRELQKQYKVEDRPLYITYGRQHSISLSIDNLTNEKLAKILINTKHINEVHYTINSSDDSLTELFINKDYYKKS